MLKRDHHYVHTDGTCGTCNERPQSLFHPTGRQRGPIRTIFEVGKIPLSSIRIGLGFGCTPRIFVKFSMVSYSIQRRYLRGLHHRKWTCGRVCGDYYTPRHCTIKNKGVFSIKGVLTGDPFTSGMGPTCQISQNVTQNEMYLDHHVPKTFGTPRM